MDKPIPEDLKDQYNRIANSLRSDWRWALPLFERIGRVEKTVASQRKLLDKYDADNTKLLHENAKLKSRTLSCVFCGGPMESVEALKSHSADCPKHPAVVERETLKAQVKRLSAPVTNVEEKSALATFDNALRNHCDRKQSENAMGAALGWLIAARLTGKEEHHA